MNLLFRIRGFLPFIAVLFLNATVDLAHKITIQNVLLKSFEGDTLVTLSAAVNAMILLPFIFLFSPSGYLSDRFSKTAIIRYAALVSVALTLLITLSYYQGWFFAAFLLTLLLAAQSAVYSPAKYGMIKKIVGVENLGTANGIVQALTVVAILLSSLLFSAVFEALYAGGESPVQIMPAVAVIGWMLVALSLLEAYFAYRLPYFEAQEGSERFEIKEYAALRYLRTNTRHLLADRNIWLSILGLSIFWGVSQVVVAAFPAHYKEMTGDSNALTIQAILAVSAVGLVLGSLSAGHASRRHIELGIVPLGALGIFGSLFAFAFSPNAFNMGLSSLMFGFFGGLFIVPLNASIQFFAKDLLMGKILAGNNFVQNLVMLAFLALAIVFVQMGLSTVDLFLFSAAVTLLGSLYTIKELPHLFTRLLLLPLLKMRYTIHVQGLENLPQSGGVLLLGNHISWIDWLILQVASPRAIKFVMHRSIYNQWYLNWFLKFFDVIPIADSASKSGLAAIRERLDAGEVVALFPEGHISYNGQLGTFKKGFELAMQGSDHPIVPFYLRGLWGSSFSRAQKHFKDLSRSGGKRHIMVALGKPLEASATAQAVKQKVFELSFAAWEQFIAKQPPLHHNWIDQAKSNLFKRAVVDATGSDLNNAKMITAVLLFAKALKRRLAREEHIGVLLPASAVGAIVNMALFVMGKKPVNLNYTLSEAAMQSALEKAGIRTVITSDTFMNKLRSKGFDFDALLAEKAMAVETVAKGFGITDKAMALLQAYLAPSWLIRLLHFEPSSLDDTATILFSSGSEGTPKGIELSHKNLLANIKQVSDLLNFKEDDLILNSLPIFHSFGLTVTTLLPLSEGIAMASVPDPTDAVAVGKMAARYRATILFGTSTFFRLYNKNRKLHPLMFAGIRITVAGAEKLKSEVKQGFKEKFGLDIFEGYGATETAPVVSVNMPNALEPESLREITANKPGSVGLPLPGTVVKIVDPQSLQELPIGEDGLIIIGGSQVMKGYYGDPEKTAEVIAEIDGVRYYKSGDKGHVDDDGFITIVDRYSRFAKVGGEMISLGSIEEQLTQLFGESVELVAVNTADEKKGEKVVLLYTGEVEPDALQMQIKAGDIPPLMMPSALYRVDELPRLASGKTDFNGAKKVAVEYEQS
jgi:acyl-[acyl-carrier-protein]-phospholipid O-acyltransferase/long-chain-fatty-acid--[acyl-carrier-protein] ligase